MKTSQIQIQIYESQPLSSVKIIFIYQRIPFSFYLGINDKSQMLFVFYFYFTLFSIKFSPSPNISFISYSEYSNKFTNKLMISLLWLSIVNLYFLLSSVAFIFRDLISWMKMLRIYKNSFFKLNILSDNMLTLYYFCSSFLFNSSNFSPHCAVKLIFLKFSIVWLRLNPAGALIVLTSVDKNLCLLVSIISFSSLILYFYSMPGDIVEHQLSDFSCTSGRNSEFLEFRKLSVIYFNLLTCQVELKLFTLLKAKLLHLLTFFLSKRTSFQYFLIIQSFSTQNIQEWVTEFSSMLLQFSIYRIDEQLFMLNEILLITLQLYNHFLKLILHSHFPRGAHFNFDSSPTSSSYSTISPIITIVSPLMKQVPSTSLLTGWSQLQTLSSQSLKMQFMA